MTAGGGRRCVWSKTEVTRARGGGALKFLFLLEQRELCLGICHSGTERQRETFCVRLSGLPIASIGGCLRGTPLLGWGVGVLGESKALSFDHPMARARRRRLGGKSGDVKAENMESRFVLCV